MVPQNHSTCAVAVRRKARGFTLVEVLVAMTIIAILAAIAFPSYTNYVTRTKRNGAKSFLVRIADLQEQFFLDNKQYAANLSGLGLAADVVGVSDIGDELPAGDADRVYLVALANTSATTYTVAAVPQLVQAKYDTKCGTLSLTHTGQRNQSGMGTNCW